MCMQVNFGSYIAGQSIPFAATTRDGGTNFWTVDFDHADITGAPADGASGSGVPGGDEGGDTGGDIGGDAGL